MSQPVRGHIEMPPKPVTQFVPGKRGETALLAGLNDVAVEGLAATVGTLPDGDAPAAWYVSTHPDVTTSFERYRADEKIWRDRFAELREISGLKDLSVRLHVTGAEISGLLVQDPPPKFAQWWRLSKGGYWVPRQRTKAEKEGEVHRRFQDIRVMPQVLDYVPGISHSVWLDDGLDGTRVLPVHIRKAVGTAHEAILAFLGADPDKSSEPFYVGPQWSRLKLSLYHAIKEAQA